MFKRIPSQSAQLDHILALTGEGHPIVLHASGCCVPISVPEVALGLNVVFVGSTGRCRYRADWIGREQGAICRRSSTVTSRQAGIGEEVAVVLLVWNDKDYLSGPVPEKRKQQTTGERPHPLRTDRANFVAESI